MTRARAGTAVGDSIRKDIKFATIPEWVLDHPRESRRDWSRGVAKTPRGVGAKQPRAPRAKTP